MFLVLQDEVRALGRLPQLNVPEAFISRHPFPGLLPYYQTHTLKHNLQAMVYQQDLGDHA